MPTFSVSPDEALSTEEPAFRTPENTLIYDIFPTKGSTVVLKTNADSGSDAEHSISTGSPFASVATGFDTSRGEGRRSDISLRSMSIPARETADVQTTGVIFPVFTPL